jgi:penicillin-binding protein-related factor A (putative recombinase)
MNPGKEFEKDFKDSIPIDTYFYRIKDSAGAWQNNQDSKNKKTRFTAKNDYDCFMFKSPMFYPVELKSTIGTSFSFGKKESMIKDHQIEGLTKASKHFNVLAGFIFNFRKVNKTYFLNIINFNRFVEDTTKSSINLNDIINYGGIEIKSELKRTRYRYLIDEFIKTNNILDLEYVKFICDERKRINNMNLESIKLMHKGKQIKINKEDIDEWYFTGLSNIDFIYNKI